MFYNSGIISSFAYLFLKLPTGMQDTGEGRCRARRCMHFGSKSKGRQNEGVTGVWVCSVLAASQRQNRRPKSTARLVSSGVANNING